VVDLVVIEHLSFGSHGSATRDLAGLWWLIVRMLDQYDMPLGVVAPGTLKRWATGNGNADKREVAAAMIQRWPGTSFRSTDEADALALASIGLHYLRVLPWEPEPYQTDSLRRVEWNTTDHVPQCE
jgi:crossover junction endodeoxyribonuclease RuvC